MIITKNPDLQAKVYQNIRESMVKDRQGMHLSDLIYCNRKAYFKKKGLAPVPSDELCMLWMTGYAFQAYMFPSDKEVTTVVDGVNCTPDIPSGIEVKSTRQSAGRFTVESMEHWKRQILGYCKSLGLLEYDLVVMFVCGNYKPPFPSMDCWHISVSQDEVDNNWALVQVKKAILEKALVDNVPPFPDCENWEWEYCEFIGNCPNTQCSRKRQLKVMK